MPLSTYPLIAWGSPDDISTYVAIGTAAVTGGFTDPFGGTLAYDINDASGGVGDARYKLLPTSLPNGTSWFAVMSRANGAGASGLQIWDDTAAVDRHTIRWTWSAGVPSTPATIGGGSGTILPPIPLGGPWYLLLFSANGLVGANANRLYLYPADPSSPAATGRTIFVVMNAVLLDLFDEAVSWEEDREGSEYQQGPSGFEDAGRTGIDHLLEGRVRFVPQFPRLDPGPVSGWYGENEMVGVNCGVKAMLRAGREKQLLRWVSDRSLSTIYRDTYLVDPLKEKPGFERNWERTFLMRLRSASAFTGV